MAAERAGQEEVREGPDPPCTMGRGARGVRPLSPLLLRSSLGGYGFGHGSPGWTPSAAPFDRAERGRGSILWIGWIQSMKHVEEVVQAVAHIDSSALMHVSLPILCLLRFMYALERPPSCGALQCYTCASAACTFARWPPVLCAEPLWCAAVVHLCLACMFALHISWMVLRQRHRRSAGDVLDEANYPLLVSIHRLLSQSHTLCQHPQYSLV